MLLKTQRSNVMNDRQVSKVKVLVARTISHSHSVSLSLSGIFRMRMSVGLGALDSAQGPGHARVMSTSASLGARRVGRAEPRLCSQLDCRYPSEVEGLLTTIPTIEMGNFGPRSLQSHHPTILQSSSISSRSIMSSHSRSMP